MENGDGIRLAKMPAAYRTVSGRATTDAIFWSKNHYLVGDAAMLEPRLVGEIWNTDDLIKYYPLFVKAVTKQYEVTPGVVLLPLDDWIGAEKGLLPYIKTLKQEINNITVVAQGLMGLYAVQQSQAIPNKVAVVDVGFRTVNIAVVHDMRVVKAKTRYDEFGVRNLIQYDFREILRSKFPDLTSNLVSLNRAWVDGGTDTGFKSVSFQEEKHLALELFMERFMNALRRDITEMGVPFEAIVFLGGLTHYIDVSRIDSDKKIILAPNPEFANVIGALKYTQSRCALDLGFGDAKICIQP